MIRLFRVFVPTSIFVLLLSEFVILSFSYTLAVYNGLEVDPGVFLWYDGGFGRILVVVLTVLFGLHFLDFYGEIRVQSNTALVLEICQAIGGAFLIEFLIAYFNADWILPRRPMIAGSAIALVGISGWRILFSGVFLRAFAVQRIVFLGANPVVKEIAELMEGRPELGFVNLGYIEDDLDPGASMYGAKVLGRLGEFREIVDSLRPDRIVVGMSERRNRMPVHDLLELRFSGIRIEEAGAVYEATCGRICTKELRPAQLIFSGELGPDRRAVAFQSLYSWGIALIGTIVSIPVVMVAALLVKLTSKGPVLFRQIRVGRGGAPFVLYKLRSMYADAEAKTGAVWAAENDPRVTPIGHWLRKLRIDEIPQLWNVLRGEMSIVGPRPERPEFVKVLSGKIPYYPQRHCVKPGITGWAQVSHKYTDTIEDATIKLEYDLYYIKHLAAALDLYIIFHTLKTMLRFRGAR